MPYAPVTPTHLHLANASAPIDIICKHLQAKDKLLDSYGMFDHQQKAILAAQSAHRSSYAEYQETGDVLKFEDSNVHYGSLLENFDIFLKDFSASMDEHVAAQYQYLSVFPLGHPEGLLAMEQENASLICDAHVPHDTLILTGTSVDSSNSAAPMI